MIAFWIAVVVGAVVAVAYIGLGVQAFGQVRRTVLADAAAGGTDSLPADSGDSTPEGGFTLKAIGAVVSSTLVIALLGFSAVFWYVPAILAIGSAVAVVVAFLIERKSLGV